MWENLTPGDIAHAKEELNARQQEMLARHAAEIGGLDAELGEIETLADLIGRFSMKLKGMATPADEPAPEPAVAKRREAGERTSHVASASSAHSLYVGIR
ncbi:MAG TPA: hypothetical protein VJR70_12315 [Stellaceae bacterium]|nr:hypothetical protein [Stellaceae bacterium]